MTTTEENVPKETLKDLGATLPLGTLTDGDELDRSLSVKPWRMKEEKELARFLDSNSSITEYVSKVIVVMCNRIGKYRFGDVEPEKVTKNLLALENLYMGDVFYAYFWLRVQAMGNHLGLKVPCAACREVNNVTADLESVEVDTAKTIGDAAWVHELRNPIEVRGRTINKITFGPTKWGALVRAVQSKDVKGETIRGSILNFPEHGEEQIPIGPNDLDDLTKRDIEEIQKGIDAHAIGPVMSVEGKCAKCDAPYRRAMDWSYQSFFGSSSA